MNGANPNMVIIAASLYGVTFTGVVTMFGIVFTSQNRKIASIEKNIKDKDEKIVFKDTCEKAHDTVAAKIEGSEKAIKAEMTGLKTTLCAKVDGINGKIDILIQKGE